MFLASANPRAEAPDLINGHWVTRVQLELVLDSEQGFSIKFDALVWGKDRSRKPVPQMRKSAPDERGKTQHQEE